MFKNFQIFSFWKVRFIFGVPTFFACRVEMCVLTCLHGCLGAVCVPGLWNHWVRSEPKNSQRKHSANVEIPFEIHGKIIENKSNFQTGFSTS